MALLEAPSEVRGRRGPIRHEPEIYLDNNATSPMLPAVADVVAAAIRDGVGNPSSAHRAGLRARKHLWNARKQVAAALGAQDEDIVFTSGATEGNNLVVLSLLRGALQGYRLVTTAVEHPSVLAPAGLLQSLGCDVVVVGVGTDGVVDEGALLEAVVPGRTLVSVQWANSETGVIQPIGRLVEEVHRLDSLVHTDAVQAVGKVPVDLEAAPADFVSLSAHKLHGPLGVGALALTRRDLLSPLMFGGTQESALRPGTENLPAIIGFGEALRLRMAAFDEVHTAARQMRDGFEEALARAGVASACNGSEGSRLPNTSSVLFDGVDGEALVARLDQLGIRCSQSSACTNRRPEPSSVLRAMGRSEREAYASVRFSFSQLNTAREVEEVARAIVAIHGDLLRGPPSALAE